MSPSSLLARMVVEALAAAGVGHVLLCPGSRSAPLAYQLGRPGTGLELHVRHDERVAAFTALGVGLAAGLGGRCGAVVTTSGTAAANLHPAVLEAHHANRRLVAVTADRPAALRGSWANQTSELQAGLFGAAVRARLDLADTDAAKNPDAARALLAAALSALDGRALDGRALDGRAMGDAGSRRPGPVHLNLGFSEPLLPDDDGPSGRSIRQPPSGLPVEVSFEPAFVLPTGPRTVVLAGDGAGAAARRCAEALGLPLLAEPSSGARGGPNAVGPYRLLLESPEFGGTVQRVLVFGRPTLSRPVTWLLSQSEVEVVLVSPFHDWPDPGRVVTRAGAVTGAPGPPGWLTGWRAAAATATVALDAVLDADAAAGRLSGPLLAREVAAALRPGETLVAAASNPIRDLDLAAHPFASPMPAVLANRGLSGIDGTISTATGVALAAGPTGPHTRLLIGDVAFLHDAGALLADPAAPRPQLQVIVLNDDGGGIFSLLEYGARAGRDDVAAAEFDRLFGTPHGADLAAICRGYGVPHRLVADLAILRDALATPVPGTSALEVRARRADLRDLHQRLTAAVARTIRAP